MNPVPILQVTTRFEVWTSPGRPGNVGSRIGAMAQLVARFHGMEEATGSNPVSSTTISACQTGKIISNIALRGLATVYR